MNAKTISFALMMGALGNTLFVISYHAVSFAPGIALDFSLMAAFIAGFYGGPLTGCISGLLVGIMPGIMYGPMGMGSWLGLIGLPFGKALTGLTAGVISKNLDLRNRRHSSLLTIPATLAAYIPEGIYTYAYFAYLLPFFIGGGGAQIFLNIILPKALGEVAVMSFLMAALMGNHGFNNFVGSFFAKPYMTTKLENSKSES